MAITKPVQGQQAHTLSLSSTTELRRCNDLKFEQEVNEQIEPFSESDKEKIKPTTEESSFATLFPKYCEIYSHLTKVLDQHGVACVLNLVKDPYRILKARDLIKLLARSVPIIQAVKIPDNDVASDVIKIGNIIQNKEPEPSHIIVIELLMDHYLLVQGKTISAMGPYKCLKVVWRIEINCMKNIHLIYHIKNNPNNHKKRRRKNILLFPLLKCQEKNQENPSRRNLKV
ncbi:hypothetical protein PSHT_04599, partial [Puccinia striiformis]